MKRIISVITAVILLLQSFVVLSAVPDDKGTYLWENRADVDSIKSQDREWWKRPFDNAKCMQNPPDFSWPYIKGAESYDLLIAKDENFSDIVYEIREIPVNYYNFHELFETGVTYYWSVRYQTAGGVSKWTEPSRFLVLSEAYEVIFPEMDEVIAKVESFGHPINIFNKNNINLIKSFKDTNESSLSIFNTIENLVKSHVEHGVYGENEWSTANNALYNAGFVYMINSDSKVRDFVKEQLLAMSEWNHLGATSYVKNDAAYRETLLFMSVAYDWLYDVLSEGEKEKVASAVRERLIYYENPTSGLTDNLYVLNTSPHYTSHGINGLENYFLPSCMIMLGEFPEAEEFFRKYLPLYINIAPTYSNEDGYWGVGLRYWSYVETNLFLYSLREVGGVDIYKKAWYQNEGLMSTYLMFSDWLCEFGEGGNGTKFDGNHNAAMTYDLALGGSRLLNWKYQKLKQNASAKPGTYVIEGIIANMESETPMAYPRSHLFEDTGVAALHSDIINDNNRISLYFRSSTLGSHGHNHPDNNSFHIHAYGERIAIDSGYYDSFLSEFDKNYTKKSYAHNTITYNGGKGQPYQAAIADGEITGFLNHPDFDMVSGSAEKSYNYDSNKSLEKKLDNFDRYILYIRPDSYVVIDDLKAIDGEQMNFEWWLNSPDNISLYKSRNGAEVIQGNVALDTKIHYPDVTGYYSSVYSGPDLKPYYPTSGSPAITERVWFETAALNKTRIITTMGVRLKKQKPTYVNCDDFTDYMLLTFDDGTKIYVSKNGNPISAPGLKSDAVAVAVKGESIMMVNGTYVEKGGEVVISSDKKASVSIGKNEIGLSAPEDVKLSVKTDKVSSLKTSLGITEPENQRARGFLWSYADGKLNVEAYSGYYNYFMNGKELPGRDAEDFEFTYYIDGNEYKTTLKGYYNHDGEKVYRGNIDNAAGFYIVDEIKGIKLKTASDGDRIILNTNDSILSVGTDVSLKLSSVSSIRYDIEKIENPDEYQAGLVSMVEAEDYAYKDGAGGKYTTRKFMSGGAGVSNFNVMGDSMTWEINVPEAGNYDIVVKYVGFASTVPGITERVISVNDKMGAAFLPDTGGLYGATPYEWIASRIKTGSSLKKGKNTITFYPVSGSWNIDWIGVVKSE